MKKQNQRYLLLVLILALGLSFSHVAFAGGLDMGSSDHQIRALGGYGATYTLTHLYKKQFGLSHEWAWILGAATTIAGCAAIDKFGGRKQFDGWNLTACAGGAGIAVVTFSFFDGGKK